MRYLPANSPVALSGSFANACCRKEEEATSMLDFIDGPYRNLLFECSLRARKRGDCNRPRWIHFFSAYGPTSGLPCVSLSGPSSSATPRVMAESSVPAWKQVKSGRLTQLMGPQSRLCSEIAASCTILISRSKSGSLPGSRSDWPDHRRRQRWPSRREWRRFVWPASRRAGSRSSRSTPSSG